MIEDQIRQLLEAASFAARAHRTQMRKDGETPYASHVFRVCLIVRHVFGIDEPAVLTAALLHDTIEDTTTDRDDLVERFGAEIADWVARLTKDKRATDDAREAAYCATLAASPWQVQVCKLADVFDNVLDSSKLPAAQRPKVVARSRRYLAALDNPDLPAPARRAFVRVQELVERMAAASAS